MNLSQNIMIEKGLNIPATGITTASTWIDMTGWDGCMFLCNWTTKCGSTGKVQIQQSSAQSTGAGIIQTTALKTVNMTSDANQMFIVDAYRPMKKYLRLRFTDFSECKCVAINAIKYSGRLHGTTDAKVDVSYSTVVPLTT